jgi:argininosuccinate lyase
MPATVGIWLAALADGVQDDRKLLGCVRELLDQCPLGTGAGFGVPLPLDRQWAAKKLGFGRVQSNPVYAQLSRGKLESSLLHLLTQVMYDLNRFACDITLFSMPELGYLNLPPSLTTGSSIMPQKRNPDVLEVLRASYHEVLACELQVKTTAANLLTGYNRDIQLTKRPTMVGLEVAKRSVAVMKLVVDSLRVDRKRCRAAMTPELFATQEAYELVMQGIPFRDAYRTVAKRFKP